MSVALMDGIVTLLTGDVREQLRALPDESVQCVVTSPPYWGLRDYGTGSWSGGDSECSHRVRLDPGLASSTLAGGKSTTGHQRCGRCGRCGAERVDAQLGLEQKPQEHVAAMTGVFREVRRVRRSDGTLWLNYGDCFASSVNGTSHARDGLADLGRRYRGGGHRDAKVVQRPDDRAFRDKPFATTGNGLKPKDKVLMPHRIALALQDDGWWVRQDIVWHKPNPMPESVTDRPTNAHEFVFLLTKSERYYYDAKAIREPQESLGERHEGRSGYRDEHPSKGGVKVRALHPDGRNKRSVWTIATQPYPEAHFATFPEALVEPCVLAGSRQGDTVLDPFAGSGTTLAVAKRLNRNAIGIELNADYCALAIKRIAAEGAQTTIELSAPSRESGE